jgi:hypothetical protein
MPRVHSRLTLVVTATKIEQVREISDEDAVAEGIFKWPKPSNAGEPLWHFVEPAAEAEDVHLGCTSPANAFAWLWKNLHGEESWDANPEVVALTLTVHKQNIDAMKEAA